MNNQNGHITDTGLLRVIRNASRSSETIIEQLKFFRNIVSKLNIAIFIHDLKQLRHIWTNNNYFQIIGYTDKEIKQFGPEWAKNNYHPDDFHILLDRIEYYRQNKGEAYSGIYRVKHKEGHWVWVYSNTIVFRRDEEGMVEQILGICIDFSNNFKTEKQFNELYRENQRLRHDLMTAKLTRRECEITGLLAHGLHCREIAEKLNISVHTANTHRKNILHKLGFKNIPELTLFTSESGLTRKRK